MYGETLLPMVKTIVQNIGPLNQDDCFLDLGSGVANVCLFVASLAPCKLVIGIEKNEVAAEFARVSSMLTG